jgi:hypothetical protein
MDPIATTEWANGPHDLPRTALRFRYPELKFGDNGEGAKTVPFSMTARTGDPVDHPYWGRVVHDMAGMKLSKPRLPVDYCHENDEVLGYANKFDTESGDLIVSGALTPFSPKADDRAAEVIYKMKAGVPYEASIDFSAGTPIVEFVPADVTVPVNGKQFAGPGVVIRQWTLRGLAICPHGADPNTNTAFSGGDKVTASFTTFTETAHMSTQNTPIVEAGKPAVEATPAKPEGATPPVEGTQLAAAPAATPPAGAVTFTSADYIAAFGDVGARWFCESKKFAEAATEFVTKLRNDHKAAVDAKDAQFAAEKTALQAEVDGLKQKLAAIDRGAPGVTFSNAEGQGGSPGGADKAKLASPLTEGAARFAAGIKLPVAAKK